MMNMYVCHCNPDMSSSFNLRPPVFLKLFTLQRVPLKEVDLCFQVDMILGHL